MVSTTVSVFTIAGTIGLAALLIAGVSVAARRTSSDPGRVTAVGASIIVVWILAAFLLGGNGVFASEPETQVPLIALGISGPIAIGIGAWYRSERVRELAGAAPLPWLIGIQLYRVLGAVFLIALAEKAMPAEFALPAGIGDIVVGLAAPAVGYAVYKRVRSYRTMATSWNVFGFADLVVAVGTGFATSPSVFQFLSTDAPNFAITRFPLVLIPTFLVPISVLLHFFVLKHPDVQVAPGRPAAPMVGLARR
ncbi:MAG: hypothetical protein WD627_01575 [Actinomycetota bacterium]